MSETKKAMLRAAAREYAVARGAAERGATELQAAKDKLDIQQDYVNRLQKEYDSQCAYLVKMEKALLIAGGCE